MKIFKAIYRGWMKFAKVLGRIQSAILLFLIYFIGVGFMAILAFIFRKDFLDKKLNDKDSFWAGRLVETPDLENSKRQF